MTVTDLYRWLMAGGPRGACDQFDAHLVASLLCVAFAEAEEGGALTDALGLGAAQLADLAAHFFPHAGALFSGLESRELAEVPEDERWLRDLLLRSTSERTRFQHCLAIMVARRCQRPHHLWQDLGLRSRRELSWLMARHFAPLATRNAGDMRWKKFLYRTICRDAQPTICASPTCSECGDFDGCFGDEHGESLLAAHDGRAARTVPRSLSQT